VAVLTNKPGSRFLAFGSIPDDGQFNKKRVTHFTEMSTNSGGLFE
jgi:hypothetical protein